MILPEYVPAASVDLKVIGRLLCKDKHNELIVSFTLSVLRVIAFVISVPLFLCVFVFMGTI